MESAIPLSYVVLTFVLIIVSLIPTGDRFSVQFPLYDQARAVSENELDLNCENNVDLCLVEACLGRECSKIGKGLGNSQMPAGEILLGNGLVKTASKDSCQTAGGKEEINNFNFRPSMDEPEELDSINNNLVVKSSQIPAARWYNSGSDILIDMDLGTIKEICSVDILFNDNDGNEIGYSVTVSNSSSKNLNEVVSGSTSASLTNSGSTHDFDSLAGRFIHLTIPGVSEFYVDDDDDDPVVTEIEVKAFPLTQTHRNSDLPSNSAENIAKKIPSDGIAQLEVSPLEFLDDGSDLLNTPMLGPKHYGMNQSSIPDMASTSISSMYTGDIFLP